MLHFQPKTRLVRERERQQITGVSKRSWARLDEQELVPARVRIGPRAIAWVESELFAWNDEQITKRDSA